LIWHDEFDDAKLDESKWNRLGDWKWRDGFWVREDADVNSQGSLLLDQERYVRVFLEAVAHPGRNAGKGTDLSAL
jgi:hypothetical protein